MEGEKLQVINNLSSFTFHFSFILKVVFYLFKTFQKNKKFKNNISDHKTARGNSRCSNTSIFQSTRPIHHAKPPHKPPTNTPPSSAQKSGTGGHATEGKDSAGGKKGATPEAPDPAIGMQDERGGRGGGDEIGKPK